LSEIPGISAFIYDLPRGTTKRDLGTEEKITSPYGGVHGWLLMLKLFLSWSLGMNRPPIQSDGWPYFFCKPIRVSASQILSEKLRPSI
jgi:hypothetical protein